MFWSKFIGGYFCFDFFSDDFCDFFELIEGKYLFWDSCADPIGDSLWILDILKIGELING